ncbi:CinA family protein [Aureimonas pseudogalii]|uniref:Nicotinamide-nucleotide amidase n=1 Tax=Aureimonas pseudogalii TaxID=1744844 RepID=A0A7W6H501_9HYPH|nr:CinA family protein [Aureimonas pseudogalii]MBB3998661.1 nicotinamide-nucleotide amidase [Aureimonas pseudogalii]
MAGTIDELAGKVVRRLQAGGLMLATAESCTGGLVAGAVTGIAGSSAVLDRGFVTYSNAAKTEMIGVPAPLIESEGAVSCSVAEAMVKGALAHSRADVAVAITGIAGPGGGSTAKPVGLVHFAVATDRAILHRECRFGDIGRNAVREASVRQALELILEITPSATD